MILGNLSINSFEIEYKFFFLELFIAGCRSTFIFTKKRWSYIYILKIFNLYAITFLYAIILPWNLKRSEKLFLF